MTRLRLGTRASALARWQAAWVADQLAARGVEVELIHITTSGDTSQHQPITSATAPGVFTKELQRALLDDRIDLAVHSLKDLPTAMVEGLSLAAVPLREDPRDVLISRLGKLDQLPPGARIGTGSMRRRAQLLHARRDLVMCDIRGNIDTRLAKLAENQYDGLVLARAGLTRLGLEAQITELLEAPIMLPAAGQGALGIETRASDVSTRDATSPLDHLPSHQAVIAERTVLAALEAGCSAPVGTWASVRGGRLSLEAVVLSNDGRERLAAAATADPRDAKSLGAQVAGELAAAGASRLIEQARG